MAEKPGRNVAVTRHCAITSDDDRPQCSHKGIANGTAVPLLHRFRGALEAAARPVDARTRGADMAEDRRSCGDRLRAGLSPPTRIPAITAQPQADPLPRRRSAPHLLRPPIPPRPPHLP